MHEAGGTAGGRPAAQGARPPARRRADACRQDGRRARRRRAGDRRPGGRPPARPSRSRPPAALAILRGNLAPEGAVIKLAGHEKRTPPGPGARIRGRGGRDARRHARRDRGGRRDRHPQRGPRRWTRHARDARGDRARGRRRARRERRADDRRALLRRDPRLHHRPRRARGRPRRPDRRGPRGRHGHDRRRRRALDLDVSDDEIAERVAAYESPPNPRSGTGVLAKYAKLVSSAAEGAITR